MNRDQALGACAAERLLAVLLPLFCALIAAGDAHAQTSAAQIVELSGRDRGLCVLIGCGGEWSAGLAADLAASGKMLVHGIALDDASLDRARKAITAARVEGLATVERLPIPPLPYRDNLVNLVVCECRGRQVSESLSSEIMRVLAPNGVALFLDPESAVPNPRLVKPMSRDMDEWTHEAHGPDGNCVSSDTAVHFPVGFRWHAGLPMNISNPQRTANSWSSTRGMAVTGGRCFTLSDSVIENLGATYASPHGMDQYVTARDAFNGLFLWRKKIGATYYGGLFYPNRAPFAAVGDLVYVVAEDGKLLALNAATGDVARAFPTTHPAGAILVTHEIVVAAEWKEGTRVGGLLGVDRRRMDFSVGEGAVEAFDTRTGNRLWQIGKLATSIRSADGILFLVQRSGPDRHEELTYPERKGEAAKTPLPLRPPQDVAVVDLRTGKSLWEVKGETIGPGEALRLDAAGLGVVTVSHENGAKTSILSAKDGKALAQVKAGSYTAFYEGAIHLGGRKYDPATGKDIGPSSVRLGSTICTPYYFVNNIIVANRGGAFIVNGQRTLYGGARGGCLFASIPAYGAFFTPQNWCMCAPAQIPGFIVFGPISGEPSQEEMERVPLVEKGPAFGVSPIPNPKSQIQNANDWPMYRHDPRRTSATPSPAPPSLDVLWQKAVLGPAPGGPVAFNWRECLNSPLTAPVVAEGIVAAAAMDRGEVIALNATTGEELWRCVAGGRVDTPPTLWEGTCLFGAHDGCVYAVSCNDGLVAWKMRAAPREERMVSYGKVESPWPVVGTVLVSNGVGYASAGHTQGSDGGIVVRAFAPATGTVLWSRAIVSLPDPQSYREMRRNDLMLQVGDTIQLMVTRMDPKTGLFAKNATFEYQKFLERRQRARLAKLAKPAPNPPQQTEAEETMTIEEIAPAIGLEGFMSWNWTRLGNRKYGAMSFGNVSGELVTWDEKMVCAAFQGGQLIRSVGREKVKPFGEKLDPAGLKWDSKLPDGCQATSLIVCPNAVIVGGGVYAKDSREGRGFIRTLSPDTGVQIAERVFPAPLAYNGMAVSGGRVYATFADGSVACLGAQNPPKEGKRP